MMDTDLLEAAKIGAKWMHWWIDQHYCDCERGHVCGLDERETELQQIEAAISKEEKKRRIAKENHHNY